MPFPDQGLIDQISLSDSVAMTIGNAPLVAVAVSDAIPLFDSFSFALGRAEGRIIFDSLSLSDSVAYSVPFSVAVADAVALSDSVGSQNQPGLGDSLSLSDSVAIQVFSTIAGVAEAVADELDLFDSVQYSVSGHNTFVGDMLSLQDAVAVVLEPTEDAYLRSFLNDAI